MENKKYLESLIIHNVYGYESKFGIKPSGVLINQKAHDTLCENHWGEESFSKIKKICGVKVFVSNDMADDNIGLVI